jgi:hypothetical protein
MSQDRLASLMALRKVYRLQAASRAKRKGRKTLALPALLYSRLTALGSLLSVALSSARRGDSISRSAFMPKMALFSKLKWARFQC